MKRITAVVAVLICMGWAVYAVAQTAISADGLVESTSGGFKYPDGTIQTSAVAIARVGDTGQTQCFDTAGASRACAGTGEDGELLAGVTWPTPRFTDNGNGTVTDNLTGLMWLKDAFCNGTGSTWQGALDWVALLNTTSIACTDYTAMTFTDWRLPNIREHLSLVDYSRNFTAVPPGNPFVSVAAQPYWSSTTFDTSRTSAFSMGIDTGEAKGRAKTTAGIGVWPVRGDQ